MSTPLPQTTHTPGPWQLAWFKGANGANAFSLPHLYAQYVLVPQTGHYDLTLEEIEAQQEANAHVLHAAPDLLEALELLFWTTEQTDTYCDFCDRHAHKEPDPRNPHAVLWVGKIVHKPDCVRLKVEQALAKATRAPRD